jgi:hypothetical protein
LLVFAHAAGARFTQSLSLGLAVLLIVAYALGTLAGVAVLVVGVSEIYVKSVQKAAEPFCILCAHPTGAAACAAVARDQLPRRFS